MKKHYDVVVIGGGASGMMAAGTAAARGRSVLVLDKNDRLGVKLSITGGGRCNITNAEFDTNTLLANYGVAKDFLYTAFSQFGVADTIQFFETGGLSVVVEDRKRAFPSTHKATDVVHFMERYLADGKVSVKLNTRVQELLRDGDNVVGVVTDVGVFTAESYILATGGQSHPETGSTGDGFGFMSSLGHTVHKSTPTLVPLFIHEKWVSLLSGVSLPDTKIHVSLGGKKEFSKRGSLLFTHVGVSGPLILNSSHKIAEMLHAGEVVVAIDLHANRDFAALEEYVLAVFDENKNKVFKNIVKHIMGIGDASVWQHIFAANNIKIEILETKVHSISREDRRAIIRLAKALPLTVKGLMGFEKAIIADGGVSLKEIDTRTMRSKVIRNLFITGDLLHINRPSGGFSLQLCWTTGCVAGSNA